jgi:hypothetical protein
MFEDLKQIRRLIFFHTIFISSRISIMQVGLLLLFVLIFVRSQVHVAEADGDVCTNGYLYVSDTNSTNIYGYDLDHSFVGATPNQTIDTNLSSQVLQDTGRGDIFASVYAGNIGARYLDGRVTFVHSGTTKDQHGDHFHIEKGAATHLKGDGFSCARPLHYVTHNGRIALFCDGFYPNPYNISNQVNTTIWIIDETKFGWGAVVLNKTIAGSHHGVAIPVDGSHILHSMATPERAGGMSTGSTPNGFIVSNFSGNTVLELNDLNDKDKHCLGFHGSSAYNYSFGLACNATHGGILMVDYFPNSQTYTSRVLFYPPAYSTHRTGTLVDSEFSPVTAGNFASAGNSSHLLLFDAKDSTIMGKQNILSLDFINGSQCSFQYEKSLSNYMFVWLPNGNLRTYNVSALNWTLANEVTVIPGMTSCAGTMLAAGYNLAAIVQRALTNKVFIVRMPDFTVHETIVPFSPFSAVVSGVPDGTACQPAKAPKKCVKRNGICKKKANCCGKLVCRRSFFASAKRCRRR